MKQMLLNKEDTILLVIDIQDNLWNAMYNREEIAKNTPVLVDLAKKVGMPILVTEQYKKGIGPTIKAVAEKMEGIEGIEKLCFNCLDLEEFRNKLALLKRKTILIAGIEAHICVLQTALAALALDFNIHIVADATGSRTEKNHNIGLERMRDAGCIITSTETAVFEIIREAGTPLFKEMLKLIK